MRVVSLALLLCVLAAPTFAGDPPDDPLLRAVAACPRSLRDAMGVAYGSAHTPIEARFALGHDGRLLLQATVHVTKGDGEAYEVWTGRVDEAGWVPYRRPLGAGAALDDAKADWTIMREQAGLLRFTLDGAVKTEERAGPADHVIAIRPVRDADTLTLALEVGVGAERRGLRYDHAASSYAVVAPGDTPTIDFTPPALPELDVDGHWSNVDEPPLLATMRGHPVVVVITDPG